MSLSRAKKRLVGRLRNSRMRPREGLVLVEGPRTAAEVVEAGVRIRFVLITPSFEASEVGRELLQALGGGTPVEHLEEDEMVEISDTESPQGVLLVCEEPGVAVDDLLARPSGRFLILDGVQDPGNVGTLVRAARAFALDGVVALDGTVDPWNPKAVRASAGSSFHIAVVKASWDDVKALLEARGVHLLVAEAGGADVADVTAPVPWALVVGNEGRGVRSDVRERGDAVVTIPMPGGAESLNAGVAGAILLYSLGRPGRIGAPSGFPRPGSSAPAPEDRPGSS